MRLTLSVNRPGQNGNDRVDQAFLVLKQLSALHAHRRLASQGLDQPLVVGVVSAHQLIGLARHDPGGRIVLAVDQLHHPYDFAAGGAQWQGEHRHGPVTETLIDAAIEPIGHLELELINIGDDEHLAGDGTPTHQPLSRERIMDGKRRLFHLGNLHAVVLRDGEPELVFRLRIPRGSARSTRKMLPASLLAS